MAKKSVVIIGTGPAGISASLYTTRAGIPTTVIGKEIGALGKAHKIENYYGFEKPISGKVLASNGIKQATRLGAQIITDEVLGIDFADNFMVKTTKDKFTADAVILAVGASRHSANIKGLKEFEGKGVSYCATCDGFFYKGKAVAVLGDCEYALDQAMELLPIVKSVTLVTNGEVPNANFPPQIKIVQTKIKEFAGDQEIEKIVFVDDSEIAVSGVFVAIGVAGATELAKRIGAKTNGQSIAVNQDMATNVPGLFSAGDCTGGIFQIAQAVHQGALAGLQAVKYLRG